MDYAKALALIKENMKKAVVGKDDIIDLLLVALICSGHVLLEDVPGLGKTTMVSALAASLGCDFQRIQFTPDVMPSDVTGFTMFHLQTGEKEFHQGSIMHQIVLADEINRASPKTQSSLLEAMQERQVTVDGSTYPLPAPFMVLATQNPIDMAGTYPLPEAQLDRFFMQIRIGYPSKADEMEIVKAHRCANDAVALSPVAAAGDILQMQNHLKNIYCGEELIRYIVEIVEATRSHEDVVIGASPRGSIALLQAASGYAMLYGRDFVSPDDIKKMAPYVLCHRMVMRSRVGLSANAQAQTVQDILQSIEVPKTKS